MNTKDGRLTRKHLLGYMFGDLGECLTFSIMGSFLTRYYINVAMIDTAILAMMTLIWKITDAVSNPIIGIVIDRMHEKRPHKAGKFRPWMLRTAPLMTITAIVVFTAPSFLDGMAKLVVIFTSYLLYGVIYNMFNVPYGSLMSAMAKDEDERARLSSARGMGGMGGNMATNIAFPVILSVFANRPELGYGVGVTVCAAVGFVFCLLSYFFTEERVTAERRLSETKPEESGFADIIEIVRRNRAFLALAIHGVFQGITQAINMAMGTYMFSDVLGSLALMSISSLCVMPFTLITLAVSPKIVKKLGTMPLIRGGMLLGTGVYLVLFLLHVFTAVNPFVHILLNTAGSVFVGVGTMMQWGLVSEATDYNEYLLGKRSEGTIYGTFNMLRRVGQAIGSSGCVALLGWIGYDAVRANAGLAQTDGAILGIKIISVLIPAIVTVGSWLTFKYIWNITPELKEKMRKNESNL